MKSITLASLVLSAAVISGCGGGSGTTPAATTAAAGTGTAATSPAGATTPTTPTTPTTTTTPSTPTAPTTPTTPTLASIGYIVDYYGDSTVYGFDKSSPDQRVAAPAPLVFGEALQTPIKPIVSNEGVNSTYCAQLRDGNDSKHPPWQTQMSTTPANVVIINHAINDSLHETLSEYKDCLTSLVTIARQNGKKVVLETPNPTPQLPGVAEYAAAMKTVAASLQVPVIDQFQYLTDFRAAHPDAVIIGADGIHPTQEGYTLKGQYAAQVFVTLPL